MIPVGLFLVRQADYSDLERIEALDRLFGNAALTRDYFEAWLRHHPEGFLVAEYDGRVYGYSMVIYLHGHQIRENWYHDTGGGTCSTHTPLGEYLYAVSIASQKQEAARALFIASRRLFIRSHVYQTIIFGRLPRFRKWVESQGYAPELLDKATQASPARYLCEHSARPVPSVLRRDELHGEVRRGGLSGGRRRVTQLRVETRVAQPVLQTLDLGPRGRPNRRACA